MPLFEDVGIDFSDFFVIAIKTFGNVAILTDFGVPVNSLVTLIIDSLDAHLESDLAGNHGDILSDTPVEMHRINVILVYFDVGSFIHTAGTLRTTVVNVDTHLRHVAAVPVSRAVEGYSLNVVVILNCDTLKGVGDSDLSVFPNYNMTFGGVD